MDNLIIWVCGIIFLSLLSLIDIFTYNKKNGYIPSILTTLFLILAFMLNFAESLFTGVFAGLLALLFTDLEFWGGIADFKVFIATGMLFNNFFQCSLFAVIFTLIGLIYKFIALKILKNKNKQIPFIPVILIAFIIMGLII